MKTAFSVLDQRIAPVFDTARHILLAGASNGERPTEGVRVIAGDNAQQWVIWFSEQKVDVLVCGAISRTLQNGLEASGIKVIPFVSGEVSEVMAAFSKGSIGDYAFTMPGCCRRRRGWRGGQGRCRRGQVQI